MAEKARVVKPVFLSGVTSCVDTRCFAPTPTPSPKNEGSAAPPLPSFWGKGPGDGGLVAISTHPPFPRIPSLVYGNRERYACWHVNRELLYRH